MTKIAIMGSAPSSRMEAPFNDQNWDIWSCSPPNFDLPRVDAWFELHNLDRKLGPPENQKYVEALKAHGRVYITNLDPRLPDAAEFPWQEMLQEFGPYFFSSSIAWMMAYAIKQKPTEMGLWGVDMSAESEYGYQRAGCHYFMQEASKRGIKLTVPSTSDIAMPHPLYAIKEHWPMWHKVQARKKELKQKRQLALNAIEAATKDMDMLNGAVGDMTYIENTWIQPNWMEINHVPLDPQSENTD